MPLRDRLWLLLPRQLRALPADLAAVVAVVVLTNAVVFVPVLNETPIRVVVGLVFVLFVPGYAFIAALFPEAGDSPSTPAADKESTEEPAEDPSLGDRGIDGIERVALSFGLSIAIVPLIGLVLNFTPFGIRLVPIVLSLSAFTILATGVAAIRRWDLPADDRFRVPYRDWLQAGKEELFQPDSQMDAALNVALAVAIILAVSSVAYAIAVPPQGEQFSEFYILTEGDDGELVADGYPTEFTPGEPESLYVGIGNNEYEPIEYSVIVQLQDVQVEGNETRVVERTELDQWSTTIAHNETWIEEKNITVSDELTGEDLRLTFLLYTGEPAAAPTRDNAYRDLHLWVTVSSQSAEGEPADSDQEVTLNSRA